MVVPMLDVSRISLAQAMKYVVYSFLLVNFALYIQVDWQIAEHTMRNGGDFLDWTAAFTTTIDESAWFILLVLLELETYVLSDESLTRGRLMVMHGLRALCFIFLAHTLYAFASYTYDVSIAEAIPDVSSLCQLLDEEVSFTANIVYTELTANNCASLSAASQFYYLDPPEFIVVTDSAGLVIEKQLAWIDLLEAITWLVIIVVLEINVRLQEKGVSKGRLIKSLNMSKVVLYLMLWGAIAYWIYRGHWMYAWDELVWIAGFIIIEKNVVDWRDESIEAQAEYESLDAASS